MPLDRLIDLLAEAAVRKLSQEREKKDATPDAMGAFWRRWMNKARNLPAGVNASLTRPDYHAERRRRSSP